MKPLYLDVETTGLEVEDRICQIAYAAPYYFETKQYLVKPPLPIKFGAMAVNHITNQMVEDKKTFSELGLVKTLGRKTNSHVVIAHNAPFDIAMLAKEGVEFHTYIDTKKLSHATDPTDAMESHRLQYLRYYHGIELNDAIAHTAEGDVAVLMAVHKKLVELLDNPTIQEQIEISQRPVLYSKIKFGKYAGNNIGDIAATDPQYLEWLLKQKRENALQGQNEEDWIYTLEHYLNN